MRRFLPIFFLIIFILPAIWSLLRPGFFVSDDGEWMIIRFSAFHQALADGQFPVRWLGRLNHEYGYPVANFLYPGFMYLAEPIHLLGFNFVDTVKILLGLNLVFSGIFAYLWLSKIFGRFPSFVGALFYVYAPYHLYDVYQRGSVGEILALTITPACLWLVEKKNLPLLGLSYGLLIISHNTLALLFTPILIIYLFFVYRPSLYPIPYTLYPLFLGLGLSAFFWLPAIFDLKYTIFQQTLVVDWQSAFFSAKHLRLLDWPSVFVLFLNLFFLKRADKKTFFFWFLFPVAFLLTLPATKFVWEMLPLNQIIQFSFRFFFLIILAGAFLAARLLAQLPHRPKITLGVILTGLLFISVSPFTKPQRFFDKGEGFYSTNEGTTTVRNEYMPPWVKVFPTDRPKEKVEIIEGRANISNLVYSSKKIEFLINTANDSKVQVNIIYFPGWQAWVNGKRTAINYENEKGVMQIPVPKGEHRVLVKFGETPLRLASDIISLGSLLILGGLLLKKYQ